MEVKNTVREWMRVDYNCDQCGTAIGRDGQSFWGYGGVLESYGYICPKCLTQYRFPVSTTYPYYEGMIGEPKLKVEDMASWDENLCCSNCCEQALKDEDGYYKLTKFCPHCGKKMLNAED